MKVEVAVLGSPSLIVIPYGLCGRRATLNLKTECVKVEVAVPSIPYGL